MIKYAMIKAILSALAATAPVAETTYLDTGIYYSDIQKVKSGAMMQNFQTVHL